MPATGNSGSISDSPINSMIPVQKTGAEKPNSASKVTKWLNSPFGRRAEITPRTTPITSAKICAVKTSRSVAGRRSAIRLVTGVLKKKL